MIKLGLAFGHRDGLDVELLYKDIREFIVRAASLAKNTASQIEKEILKKRITNIE